MVRVFQRKGRRAEDDVEAKASAFGIYTIHSVGCPHTRAEYGPMQRSPSAHGLGIKPRLAHDDRCVNIATHLLQLLLSKVLNATAPGLHLHTRGMGQSPSAEAAAARISTRSAPKSARESAMVGSEGTEEWRGFSEEDA